MATTKKTAAPKKSAISTTSPRRTSVAKADAIAKSVSKNFIAKRQAAKKTPTEKEANAILGGVPAKGTVLKQAVQVGLPVHEVRNVMELRNVLGDFPLGAKFTADRKGGKEVITIINMRGRPIAEVHAVDKKAK